MPWKVFREEGKFCLHKMVDGKKSDLVACHDTANQARRQQAALYVSEKKEMSPEDIEIIDEDGSVYKDLYGTTSSWGEDLPVYITDAHSLDELDTQRAASEKAKNLKELVNDFQGIVNNIISTPSEAMNEDPIKELDTLFTEFKSRASELLDSPLDEEKAKREDVSAADKKRAVSEYGNVTYADPTNKKYPIDTAEHIRAAWSYINMPKNAAKYSDKGASIKRKVISAWKKKIDSKGPPAAKEAFLDSALNTIKDVFKEFLGIENKEVIADTPNLLVYKEEDGEYGWIASYSNMFMDRDNPPDIIASFAHKEFVEKADRGEVSLPVLELWHVPEWKIGYATALAYDDSGFPIAIGRFDDNQESKEIAEWLSKQTDWGVSHGMWNRTIKRDPEDPSVIIAYETHEISYLPKERAANLLADFNLYEIKELEEVTMTIPEEKRQELLKRGLPEQTLSALEARNKKKAETASAEGVKSKETEETQPVPEDKTSETTEPPAEKKDSEESEFPTRQEVAEAVATVIAPIVTELKQKFEDLNTKYEEMTKAITDFKESDEKRIKEIISMTPRDSLASLMASRFDRASSSKQTKVGKGDSLLENKPREEEDKKETGPKIGIPFIDKMRADGK